MPEPLELELKTYEKNLPSLMSNAGKYVLIFGEKVEGVYDSYADALKIGYANHGVKPFLVKKIASPEQVAYFTRDLGVTCRS